nr:hydrogenase [synthetic construct]
MAAPAAEAPLSHVQQALAELAKPKDDPTRKHVCVQVAPAVRVAIAETLGLAPGATTPKQLAEGLRRLGFDEVFDTLFGADLTIMEEGSELLHRLTEHLEAHPHSDEPLPMFTSCCPGWIAMLEKSYPDLIPYVSSCKSPQMMMGAMVKTYLSEKQGIPAKDIVMVSVMPCVRKQGEADREWFCVSEPGVRDVDHVITTAELGNIFKERGINLAELPEGEWDNPMGVGSGAGVLFGTTGGVMEAALRTAYELFTGTPLPRLSLSEVRGLEGIKESTLHLTPGPTSPFKAFAGADGTGITLNIAVANGLGNAKKLIKQLAAGESKYDFIEVMACPGGCIGGGGQPRSADKQILQKRQAAMYDLDERAVIRRSHENPLIGALYEKFLGEPNGHKAHELLHTHYVAGGVPDEK